jgi:MOSC domain-containing protein YiiM
MEKVGQVINLFISKTDMKHRVLKQKITLDKKGIIDDKFYTKNILRSVLITSTKSYTLAKKYHILMPYGSLGENLLIDIDPCFFPKGLQLHIGTCILEITDNCSICEHLSVINKELPKILEYDRGIFARIIQEGEIQNGDHIFN